MNLPPGTKVYLACRPVDLRSGFNGLAAKVQQLLGRNPFLCVRRDSVAEPYRRPLETAESEVLRHIISCLSERRRIVLRRHAGGAICSRPIFRTEGYSGASVVERSAARWIASQRISPSWVTSGRRPGFTSAGLRASAISPQSFAVLRQLARRSLTAICAIFPQIHRVLQRCQRSLTREGLPPNDL
jgi:IS66 Orf2 like protein